MKNILINIAKEQRYLFACVTFSFLLAIVPFLFFLIELEHSKNLALIFLTPFVLLISCSFVAYYTHKKYPKATKIITIIINLFIIFFIQTICGLFASIHLCLFDIPKPITDIKYYQKAINEITDNYRVAHFPRSIPEKAHNTELYQESGDFFGSEYITLKFNIDKKYIEQELKKYKFIKIVPFGQGGTYFIATDNGRIKLDNFTFYIINDKDNENLKEHHFPYHYGIGTNKTFSQIVYYYTNPD